MTDFILPVLLLVPQAQVTSTLPGQGRQKPGRVRAIRKVSEISENDPITTETENCEELTWKEQYTGMISNRNKRKQNVLGNGKRNTTKRKYDAKENFTETKYPT